MKRGRPLSAESLGKVTKDPKQRTLTLAWTLGRAQEATLTDLPRRPPEQVNNPGSVDLDAQSTVSFQSATAPLVCGLSDVGSSASACRSMDSADSERLEAELARVKAMLARSDSVIMTEVRCVLDAVISNVVDRVALEGGKKLYRRFTTKEKKSRVELFNKLVMEWPDEPVASLVAKLRARTGITKLDARTLRRWRQLGNAKLRTGPKVNVAFETSVLDKLVYATLDKVDTVEKANIVANVCYDYEIIKQAALEVQQAEEFRNDAKVSRLKFSQCWVGGWLRRCAMRRRRSTTQLKDLPSPKAVSYTHLTLPTIYSV